MDIITTHLHADFDGLAAMVAASKLSPGAVLVFPGGAQETVRRFLAVHDLGLTRLKDLDLQQVTRLGETTHAPTPVRQGGGMRYDRGKDSAVG
jgi:tRNA nucleotidyltransferase (CCA-adding enzyme)